MKDIALSGTDISLVTFSEVQQYGFKSLTSSLSSTICFYIDAVSEKFNNYVGYSLKYNTWLGYYNYDDVINQKIYLRNIPIEKDSITSIQYLTSEPDTYSNYSTFPNIVYSSDNRFIKIGNSNNAILDERLNRNPINNYYKIIYKAGYEDIPLDIKLMVVEEVVEIYQKLIGAVPRLGYQSINEANKSIVYKELWNEHKKFLDKYKKSV